MATDDTITRYDASRRMATGCATRITSAPSPPPSERATGRGQHSHACARHRPTLDTPLTRCAKLYLIR